METILGFSLLAASVTAAGVVINAFLFIPNYIYKRFTTRETIQNTTEEYDFFKKTGTDFARASMEWWQTPWDDATLKQCGTYVPYTPIEYNPLPKPRVREHFIPAHYAKDGPCGGLRYVHAQRWNTYY